MTVLTAPVTAGQQRLWFLAQVDPDAVDYHIPLAFRLRGPLDPATLVAALNDTVARQGVLRTRFPVVDGTPAQEVLDDWRLTVERFDVSGPDAEARAAGLVARCSNTPFDLAAAPPVRAALLRLGPDDHVLCLVIHHILVDDWSLNLLCDEVSEAYVARLDGRPPKLAELPVQYADYARAEAESAPADPTSGAAARSLAYWRERLDGAPVLDLVTDFPRPARRGTAGAFDGFHLGASAAAAVRRLGRTGRTTPFMTVLAGYLALLGLYTGQQDICVGTPVSDRDRTELEPLIGFFLDTVVLRGDLSGDPTFQDLLHRAKATAVGAFTHRHLPTERLLNELGRRRDPARTPLFDTMLIVHGRASKERAPRLPGVTAEYFDPGHHEVKFDLTVECLLSRDDLKVVTAYRTDLFAPESMARLAHRLGTLLELAAEAPDVPLSRLYARLAAAERDPSARCAPATAAHPNVLERFAAQAAANPDAVAIEHADTRLSYAELYRRARVLAGLLRGRGVGPGTKVAVLLERGVELVVTVLAVGMSGAAYVPLDPDAPPRRLAGQVADVPLLVTTAELAARVGPGIHTVDLSAVDWRAAEALETPGPLAYAIHTSGTSGRPKTVAVSHAALAARVAWMRDRYAIGPTDRVLQFCSPTFDTFAEEVYPCLTSGATLVVPTGAPAELPDFLATAAGRSLTVLDLPTSYWHELVSTDTVWPAGLRLLILGGEQVRADLLARWFATVGERVEVLNTYGPTEATIIATAARLTPSDAAHRPPIGAPIGDTCLHVVDESGGELPDGVPGELVIGGAGVAEGYLGQPELTAAQFAPRDGTRHYRTGDRVRRRPDGRYEFLGRLDDQLKVRGHRVEPAEVESALTAHPAIRQAVVSAGDGALVAHLVPEPGATVPDRAELRAYLGELLPAYAIPTAFGLVERIPLTAHGKVDRTALPPVAAGGLPTPPSRPPFTDAERLVAQAWAEVLEIGGDIGAQDDFFDLGGHSLLATRVAARLRAAIGLRVPLRTLFDHTTVADLARAVEELLIADIESLTDDEVDRQLAGPAR